MNAVHFLNEKNNKYFVLPSNTYDMQLNQMKILKSCLDSWKEEKKKERKGRRIVVYTVYIKRIHFSVFRFSFSQTYTFTCEHTFRHTECDIYTPYFIHLLQYIQLRAQS